LAVNQSKEALKTDYISWDGKDDDGNPVEDGVYFFAGRARSNGSESDWQYIEVGVDRVPIKITSFNVPYAFAPKKSGLKINYTLNEAGFVTAKVFTRDRFLVRILLNNVKVQAGNNSVVWDGKEPDGDWAEEGEYHIELKVIDLTGNSSDVVTSRR